MAGVTFSFLRRAGFALAAVGVLSGTPSLRAQATPAGTLGKADLALVRRVDDHYNHLASLRTAYTRALRRHGDGPDRDGHAAC